MKLNKAEQIALCICGKEIDKNGYTTADNRSFCKECRGFCPCCGQPAKPDNAHGHCDDCETVFIG